MFVKKKDAYWKTGPCTELLLFSVQLYIANAAIKQITKRNKLDVFQLFAINHGSSSPQPIHMRQ